MTSSDQPCSVLCLGLGDADRSRVSEEAHRFGWLIRFAGNATEARATGNGKRPDLILFDVNSTDDAATELVRQCTAHPLLAVSHAAPAPSVQRPESTMVHGAHQGVPQGVAQGGPQGAGHVGAVAESADGTVLLEPGSIHRFEDYEQQILRHALLTTGWNVKRAAQLLGIGRATLYRKIDRYKLRDCQPERNAG